MSVDSLPSNVSENFSQFLQLSPYKFSSNGPPKLEELETHSSRNRFQRNLRFRETPQGHDVNFKEASFLGKDPVDFFFPPKIQPQRQNLQRKIIKESPKSNDKSREEKNESLYDYQNFIRNYMGVLESEFMLHDENNTPFKQHKVIRKNEASQKNILSHEDSQRAPRSAHKNFNKHLKISSSCSSNLHLFKKLEDDEIHSIDHHDLHEEQENRLFQTYSSIQEEPSKVTISPGKNFVNQAWKEKFDPLNVIQRPEEKKKESSKVLSVLKTNKSMLNMSNVEPSLKERNNARNQHSRAQSKNGINEANQNKENRENNIGDFASLKRASKQNFKKDSGNRVILGESKAFQTLGNTEEGKSNFRSEFLGNPAEQRLKRSEHSKRNSLNKRGSREVTKISVDLQMEKSQTNFSHSIFDEFLGNEENRFLGLKVLKSQEKKTLENTYISSEKSLNENLSNKAPSSIKRKSQEEMRFQSPCLIGKSLEQSATQSQQFQSPRGKDDLVETPQHVEHFEGFGNAVVSISNITQTVRTMRDPQVSETLELSKTEIAEERNTDSRRDLSSRISNKFVPSNEASKKHPGMFLKRYKTVYFSSESRSQSQASLRTSDQRNSQPICSIDEESNPQKNSVVQKLKDFLNQKNKTLLTKIHPMSQVSLSLEKSSVRNTMRNSHSYYEAQGNPSSYQSNKEREVEMSCDLSKKYASEPMGLENKDSSSFIRKSFDDLRSVANKSMLDIAEEENVSEIQSSHFRLKMGRQQVPAEKRRVKSEVRPYLNPTQIFFTQPEKTITEVTENVRRSHSFERTSCKPKHQELHSKDLKKNNKTMIQASSEVFAKNTFTKFLSSNNNKRKNIQSQLISNLSQKSQSYTIVQRNKTVEKKNLQSGKTDMKKLCESLDQKIKFLSGKGHMDR